jgi:hypothetical protein
VGALSAVPAELVDFDPEVVVASPGFAPHHPVIAWTRERGTALWGDIELAWRVRDKVLRAGRHARGMGADHRHERQDDDDPAHRDDARRGRTARRAVRQHRRTDARRRA